MITLQKKIAADEIAQLLSTFAVEALLAELYLTPKPGLVDMENNGAHSDLTQEIMELSACSLKSCFYDMVVASLGKQPSQSLREQLAAIGRYGEEHMRQASGGINTHKGAIWCLGLISSAAAIQLSQDEKKDISCDAILSTAGYIARYDDRFAPVQETNGSRMKNRYHVRTAREEARAFYPAIRYVTMPAYEKFSDEPEDIRSLNVLLSLMAMLDDTCILHRSNMYVLREVQRKSRHILQAGGLGVDDNWRHYAALDAFMMEQWISPGGSADLLAATFFIQNIIHHFKN